MYTYVVEPLSKLWYALKSVASAADGEAGLTIEDLLNLVQHTTPLIGQTNNTMSYYTWLNVLTGGMKTSSWQNGSSRRKGGSSYRRGYNSYNLS